MKGDFRLKRADMAALQPHAKRLHGAHFSLSLSPLPSSRRSAFTCIVAKQVAKKAALRNLLKRRCREAARTRMQTLRKERPLALLFRAKSSAAKAEYAEIRRDIDALFDKISDSS